MRVSLKDIAEEAGGISVAAVSLALRGSPEVSEKTRAKVRKIAAQLGYRPRPEVAQLATRRWRNRSAGGMKVAFLSHRGTMGRSSRLWESIREAGRLSGFDPEVFLIEEHERAAALGRVLSSRGIEAMIVSQLFDGDFVSEFPWREFTGVCVSVGCHAPGYDRVVPDITGTGCSAWRRAVAWGARRVGFAWIKEATPTLDAAEKEAAFLLCREEGAKAGVETVAREFVLPLDEGAYTGWIEEHRLEVVVGQVTTFLFPISGRVATGEPGFISVNLRHDDKAASGYILNFERMVARAWQELDRKLRNFERGVSPSPSRIVVAQDWNEGRTLPPRGGVKAR